MSISFILLRIAGVAHVAFRGAFATSIGSFHVDA